jgi:glycosyltransferase involved in cell wall biosynthesis
VVVAKEQATYLRGSGLLRQSPEVIPSGVDPELLERPRKESPAEPGFEFLFAGRLVADKGVKQLLEAFGRLSRTHPTARLTFMGAGPEEGALRERATAAALDQTVAFLGALPHAEALDAIAAADAFVLPSHAEGSPLSVTEALALGTPVVATHVGALPELLGADGLLVEPGDATSLARAMARVMEDRGLVEQLVREGRQRIAAHYTWPAVALAYERVFAGALDD